MLSQPTFLFNFAEGSGVLGVSPALIFVDNQANKICYLH